MECNIKWNVYSALKQKEILFEATAGMNLKDRGKISPSQKDKYYRIPLI